MVGISEYGMHIPACRISSKAIAEEWNMKARDGEKAVANFDEDSLSMAVNAVLDCLGGKTPENLHALFFASTTSPYLEKQVASLIAIASDLRNDIRTADFSSSLRSGTTAMLIANDSIKNSQRKAIVVASDVRNAKPGSEQELMLGDSAVSLLLDSSEDTIADITAGCSISDDYSEVWREEGDEYLEFDDDVRFSRTFGYVRLLNSCVKHLLEKENLKAGKIAKAVMCAPDGRSHGIVAKSLGFSPEQLQDTLINQLGFTGTPHPLLLLISALEEAKPDDIIVMTGYGNGCDAILLKATDNVTKATKEKKLKKLLGNKRRHLFYAQYLSYRRRLGDPLEKLHPFSSTSLAFRDRGQNLRFHGKLCTACETVLTLPLKVCPYCGTKSAFKDFKLSKRGKIVTYTQEHYYPTPDPPVTMAVVDLEGGGRVLLQMTDSEAKNVKIGMKVGLTFRKLHEGGGFINYYWKYAPETEKEKRGE